MTTTAAQIHQALKTVRDTRETVAIGPYVFVWENCRGADRCRINQGISVSGFAFTAVSLKRVAANLAKRIDP